MTGTLIASTPKADMHALAFQGITAISCYAQIREMLLRKFGDECMLLFAKPVENAANDEIDWYSPVQGPVQKMADLPEEEQEKARTVISSMAGEILRYAEELIQSGEHLKVTRGNILRLTLSCPDKNCLYAVGKQPVFICWGCGPGTPGVEPENLARIAVERSPSDKTPTGEAKNQSPAPASEIPATARSRSYSLWWWLLPLLLLLLLPCLLFGSFGGLPAISGQTLFDVPGFDFLSVEAMDEGKISSIRNGIEGLEARVASHIAMCMPDAGKAATPPKTGATEMPALEIPESAENTAFLEGRWLCETGLFSERTNEPLKMYFSFDRNGAGQATIYESRDQCRGTVTAKMENKRLYLDMGRAECQNNRNSYRPVIIECFNASGQQTECRGKYQNGREWTAKFIRVD